MLTIRDAQMDVLSAAARRSAEESIVEQIALRFPALAAPDRQSFSQRVAAALGRARAYGFTRRDHILRFVELDMERGPAWELAPEMEWALGILDQPDIDPAGRLHRLGKRLAKENRHAR
ncbi:MAG TPA: hypothetical protein DEH78_25625 [Solibacterales bacterium]|nr:hypothetical protein [Bryobacterales bacterium]